jgi:hypothetical protein
VEYYRARQTYWALWAATRPRKGYVKLDDLAPVRRIVFFSA